MSQRLIIIHGLNNNADSFVPLKEHFEKLGWETHFLILPCHGRDRNEARDFKEAFACFDQSIRQLTHEPYSVIAFSQGALYLQLWLEKRPDQHPRAQVLLSPALHILRHKLIERIVFSLPPFLPIQSFSPKGIKRYATIRVRDYRILLQGLDVYQKLKGGPKVPTLILIDPEDELVDAGKLQEKLPENKTLPLRFELFPRSYLKRRPGIHHLLFHPDYFSGPDWEAITARINQFLSS